MSQGNPRATTLTAPLWDMGLPGEVHNRIYEAVDVLTDRQAEQLVKAIIAVYQLGRTHERRKP